MPLEDGLALLLQRRNRQTSELKKAAIRIFSSLQSVDTFEEQNETGNFVLVPRGESIGNKITRIWETAKANIDLMNNFQEGMERHEKDFDVEIKALNKGVKIRDILAKTQKKYHARKSFLALMNRKSEYQVRFLHVSSPAKLMIKDSKEVFISTSRKVNSIDYPFLWSNNQIIVQLIHEWFDNIWEKSRER